MSQFILFIDEVGAEFAKVRATRKDIIGTYEWKPIRFVPVDIRPLEVIAETGAAGRAAGGFLLAGPVGAAAGVLLGKGPKVLFELTDTDGGTRRGIIDQKAYPALRKQVEAIQRYTPGQSGKQLAALVGLLVLIAICIALGPLGAALLIAGLVGVTTARSRRRRKQEMTA